MRITLFAIPKPFEGHIGVIQENALRSWLQLGPDIEVLLFGTDAGTEDMAHKLGIRHIPELLYTEHGAPRVDDLFERARREGKGELLCYVNADIILMEDFVAAAAQAGRAASKFLMVGHRWDLDITERLAFEPGWQQQLLEQVRDQGILHTQWGTDYFLYTRNLYRQLPPLALGRGSWDNWLLYQARADGGKLIDATAVVLDIHQNHDYSHLQQTTESERKVTGLTWKSPDRDRNLELVGDERRLFSLRDATHRLTPRGLRNAITPRNLWRHIEAWSVLYPVLQVPVQTVTTLAATLRSLVPAPAKRLLRRLLGRPAHPGEG